MAKKVSFTGHTIICGWNFQGTRITQELLSADIKTQRGIVVLANLEERPEIDDNIEFIKGDPSRRESLIRAGVMRADSVIVLTELTKNPSTADAQALMIVLAVETLNRDVYTCVQIMDSTNRIHLENAHADEIICLDQMGGSLMVSSALNHGVAYLVTELLSFNKGSEFYRYDKHIPDDLVGKEYAEVVASLSEKRMLLLGFETDYSKELARQMKDDVIHKLPEVDRAVIVNPSSHYKLQQGDALFIVAEEEPDEI